MAGKADYPGTGPQGKVKAVLRHDYGLGPLVHRVADAGHDPLSSAVDVDYLHNQSPRPGDLSRYMGAASLIPAPTGSVSGYPRLPRYHQLSAMPVMGDDLYLPFDRGQ
jgi:hypothetical protein